jgi:hypothetical protein
MLHAAAALSMATVHGTQWIGWVGLRAGLNAMKKGNIFP